MMSIQHIAGYKFTALQGLEAHQHAFQALCEQQQLRGTILLSQEGININLAGTVADIEGFLTLLKTLNPFADMTFHQTLTDRIPYQRLKIKIKNEIVTFRQSVHPEVTQAPDIAPEHLKQWLDEKRDFTLLDVRNDYEIAYGTFKDAIHCQIADFCDLPQKETDIPRDKPIVMFCTGGIRCEKASLYLLQQGYQNVFQLKGGILGYFKTVGGSHYQGDCFVFDERTALTPTLTTIRNPS